MTHFRNLSILLAMGSALLTPRGASAADIVNGWSAEATIAEVYSVTSLTMFRLSGVSDGCGHPQYWQLPLTDTVASKAKIAMIVAAFSAGKVVSLRCENSYVSDFRILQ